LTASTPAEPGCASSGLGLAICHRLITDFLHTRPQTQTLRLIFTTRSLRKSTQTLEDLEAHVRHVCAEADKKLLGASMLLAPRVKLQPEQVDLCRLVEVKRLARKLKREGGRIDVVILNAGIGGWEGLNWGLAIWMILTDWVNATTWPTYKKPGVGWVTRSQMDSNHDNNSKPANGHARGGIKQDQEQEPPLGEVFCANVFGHYVLTHELAPLLSGRGDEGARGRIIWLSSLEAYAHSLHVEDLQAIENRQAYESSKRITDILAMSSDCASTKPWVDTFLCAQHGDQQGKQDAQDTANRVDRTPKQYLAHPGICATAIMPLSTFMQLLFVAGLYISRWLGSPWHTVTSYSGAHAPVWLALSSQTEIDEEEERKGKGKWGSGTDMWGNNLVLRTEVEGWGWTGRVGESVRSKGRWKGAKDLTVEATQEFELTARDVWKQMEELRREWDGRLGEVTD